MTPDQRTARTRAIQAGADRLRDQHTPEIWRSYEALAEAVIDAAHQHLTTPTTTLDHHQEDLFA